MKASQFKDYSELPLFLNAEMVAKVLIPSSAHTTKSTALRQKSILSLDFVWASG